MLRIRADDLLSGGAKLDGAAFPLVDGKRNVPSGTVVSRDSVSGAATYTAFNALYAQHALVWKGVSDTGDTPDVELYIAGEVRLDSLPTALTTDQVSALKSQFVLTTGDA